MSKQRVWLVYALLALIVGGSAVDVLFKFEHWPFSWYPMYASRQNQRSLRIPLIYGVTASGTPQEIELQDLDSLRPFDNSRLKSWLGDAIRDPNSTSRLRTALQDILRRYEAGRVAGRHAGPPLQAARLYWTYWDLEPWASNRATPTQRELVLEVVAP